MPYQPAILGTARLGNFRLGYRPAALTAVRQTKARFTLAGEPVRVRVGSVTIHDGVNDAPNTCSLTVDAETPPVSAQRLRITINSDAPRLLFDGALETVEETYEGLPSQLVYPCTAQDDTPRANRRIPLGYWEAISATTVAHELVAQFAPGFTTAHVQAALPAITVHFEGSEAGMSGCLRQIAKLIGGYFYWEARDLHLFTTEADDLPDDLDSTPGRILDDPPISVTRDDAQLRTRVYGKGHQEATLSDVEAGADAIPLGDVSMYNPAGGQAISESQILEYTGTVVGGLGALVGTTLTPTNGPTVSPRATTGLTAGARDWAVTFGTAAGKSLPSPLTSLTLGDALAPPSSAPAVAKAFSGNLSAGVYKWKLAYKTALGKTLASVESAALTMDDVAAPAAIGTASVHTQSTNNFLDSDADYRYKFTFSNGVVETAPSPASNTFHTPSSVGAGDWHGKLTRSGNSTPPAGFDRKFYRTEGDGSTWKAMPGQSDGFGSDDGSYYYDNAGNSPGPNCGDANLGGAAPSSSTAVYRSVNLTGIQVSSNALVTHVTIYRTASGGSVFKEVADITNGTTSYLDTLADASLGATELSVATAVNLAADLSAISIGPTGTTYRDLWRTEAAGSQLKFLATLANNTTTVYPDVVADGSLGANIHTTDTSGLVAESGEVPAGSTSLLVTATPFTSTGGWVFIGAMPVRYGGITGSSLTGVPASGHGSLTTTVRYGSELVAASMLIGVSGLVRPLIPGAPIHILVERNDLAAQAELAAREGEGDGIIEHRITDDRMGEAALIALCDADLAQFSRPIVTVPYATRDVKTKSGKPIVIDLPSPFIDETLTIQDVTIDQIDIVPGLAPRFTVTASSVRFSLEDLLRRLASGLEGA